MTAHVFQNDFGGKWYFHFKGANGQIVAVSQGYVRKGNCERALQNFIIGVADVRVVG